jgi:hypothetical protein
MTTAFVVDKQNSTKIPHQEKEPSTSTVEMQSVRRLISAITGAAIQTLTETGNVDYSIGVTMFKRWESAQSELEEIKGRSGLLDSSRELKQELEQAFISGSSELESSERSELYKRARNLLEKLDCCLESIR